MIVAAFLCSLITYSLLSWLTFGRRKNWYKYSAVVLSGLAAVGFLFVGLHAEYEAWAFFGGYNIGVILGTAIATRKRAT